MYKPFGLRTLNVLVAVDCLLFSQEYASTALKLKSVVFKLIQS